MGTGLDGDWLMFMMKAYCRNGGMEEWQETSIKGRGRLLKNLDIWHSNVVVAVIATNNGYLLFNSYCVSSFASRDLHKLLNVDY